MNNDYFYYGEMAGPEDRKQVASAEIDDNRSWDLALRIRLFAKIVFFQYDSPKAPMNFNEAICPELVGQGQARLLYRPRAERWRASIRGAYEAELCPISSTNYFSCRSMKLTKPFRMMLLNSPASPRNTGNAEELGLHLG